MPAYFGVWQVASDDPVPPELIALARNLVGGMLEIGVPRRELRLADGSVIRALIVNGFPKVSITQVKGTDAEEGSFTDLWAPRGFVVYPAFNDAKFGIGLPIVQDDKAGPYDKSNLAPGLDRARWTDGGPCGEVLVSQDKDAGYPTSELALTVPMLYHPTLGPTFHWDGKGYYDARKATGAWTSYRIELAVPVINFGDEDVAASLALLELINSYRGDNNKTALSLQPRGYYRPAKIMASIMLTNGNNGATSRGYPATYQTEDDRTTKDGFSADVIGVPFTTFNRGDNLTTYELRQSGGGAAGALAAWKASPETNTRLLKDVGPAAFGDTGIRGGFVCADVIERHRWIQAGNMNWQSPDESLPPISWHGFASVNLAWETYPAVFDIAAHATTPLQVYASFTDENGECWLRYPRNGDPRNPDEAPPNLDAADVEPAMGRHIYCRGRAIAMAPRGGLVWAASVVPIDDRDHPRDRLLVLVHHADETPVDYTHEGFTRYLRVWWCDVPRREHMRIDPTRTICGVVDETLEADDTANDYAWKGGQVIDLGVMPDPPVGRKAAAGPNSLKYASQWRFSPDGTRAICLRDYGAYLDYGGDVIETPVPGDPAAPATLSVTTTELWSRAARAVELVFDCTPTDTTASVTFHGFAGSLVDSGAFQYAHLIDTNTPPLSGDTLSFKYGPPDEQLLADSGTYPIAVDYDAAGRIIYAYYTQLYAGYGGYGKVASTLAYQYVGVGSAGDKWLSNLRNIALVGTTFKTPHQSFDPVAQLVLDVRSACFVGMGLHPRYAIDITNSPSPISGAVADTVLQPAECGQFTDGAVNGVRLWRAGTLISEEWYGNPDGALWTLTPRCYTTFSEDSLSIALPVMASHSVQGFHAERFGETVYGYQVSPTPRAVMVLESLPSEGTCGCAVKGIDLVGGTPSHMMFDNELNPRGGKAVASAPMPEADWLIYAKVV